jgi:hypothetical protein
MKKVLSIAAAVSLATAIAAPVLADDENVIERGAKSTGNAIKSGAEATGGAIKSGAEATGGAIKSGAEATGHAIKEGAQATGAMLGLTETDRERFEANRRGERRVTGTVTAIDHDTGKVSLAADGTSYQLHFPADSLKNVATGQRLAVTMAFALPSQPLPEGYKKEPREEIAGDQPARTDHWMTGTVTDVDSGDGTVGITTDAGLLTVQFSPAEVRDVKAGEKIALALGFEPVAKSAD